MSRQECVTCLEKMIRFIKLFNNLNLIGRAADLCHQTDDLGEYTGWLIEVEAYIKKNIGDSMEKRIREIQVPSELVAVAKDKTTGLSATERKQLESFTQSFINLKQFCEERNASKKGMYRNLPDALANEKAVTLLYRATDAGYLDYRLMPTPGTSTTMLKLIGYAVGKILTFKKHEFWPPFNYLWCKKNKGKINLSHIPKHFISRYQDLIALYPEVDFNALAEPDYALCYSTDFSDSQLKELCKQLRNGGYIDSKTTPSQFIGMFGRSSNHNPVVWRKAQNQLAYFVYIAFNKSNRRLWDITSNRFIVNDHLAHSSSMRTSLVIIKSEGKIEHYDPDIIRIINKISTSLPSGENLPK